MTVQRFAWLGASLTLMAACSGGRGHEGESFQSSSSSATATGVPTSAVRQLPWAGGTGALTPWGGTDPAKWRPEAILANAVSEALNAAWAQPGAADAVVAVPVAMQSSNFFEFGDGQSNAAPSFGWWNGGARPPVVATLVRYSGSASKIFFRFNANLPAGTSTFALQVTENGSTQTATLNATPDASGDLTAEWDPPSSLGLDNPLNKTVVLVHPQGWNDWFPVWFHFPVRSIAAFKATVPQSMQTFADGGDIQDHERVGSAANGGSTANVRLRLQSHQFGATNYSYFNPQDVHAIFPFQGHNYVTGVGQGWTWVADQSRTPFKIMYTCFQQRTPSAEATAQDGGVPSGGGWHKITDPAETVLNDLEAGPVALGAAQANPLPASMLPTGGYSYGLTDIATVRFVHPGEAFITPRGGAVTDAQGQPWDQANYHWYFFQQAQDVCTEEWVSPVVPDAALDFVGSAVSVQFEADSATTSWGQNVYVVGDRPELGAWNPQKALKLAPTAYPSWMGTIALPQGSSMSFKFIKIDGSGNVVWEGGGNRSYATPAVGGLYAGTWQN
ncbi:MAG TPA: CBM20 domain-containing protein [Polyangiaceae bacterium]